MVWGSGVCTAVGYARPCVWPFFFEVPPFWCTVGAHVLNCGHRVLGPNLGGTRDRIFDFSFWGRTGKGQAMTLEFVSWADFGVVLRVFSSLTRLEGSWDQVCPESDRHSTKTINIRLYIHIPTYLYIYMFAYIYMYIYIYIILATKELSRKMLPLSPV